jgi:hypothetical protein
MARGAGYAVLRYFLNRSYDAGKSIPNFLHPPNSSIRNRPVMARKAQSAWPVIGSTGIFLGKRILRSALAPTLYAFHQ